MSRIGSHVRAAVNPVSTAATRWWCHSAMRNMLTGYGPTARQRRFIRRGMTQGAGSAPPAEQMKARTTAIDQLLTETTTKSEKHSNTSNRRIGLSGSGREFPTLIVQ